MHLIGRWERVRSFGTLRGAWSRPYLLDRKWSRLSPYLNEEWVRLRDGRIVPAIRGGAFSGSQQSPYWYHGFYPPVINTAAGSTLALDSAYTFNSAGDGVACKVFGLGKTLNAAYYYNTTAPATPANVTSILFEYRNDNAGAAPNRASPTLHASATADPTGETNSVGWHKIGGMSFTETLGTMYWGIVADAAGDGHTYAVDFMTVQYGFGESTGVGGLQRILNSAHNHTAGFNTNPTGASALSNILLEYSDGATLGYSTVSHATVASNTNRKGLRLGGVTEQIKCWGVLDMTNPGTSWSGLELYADDGTAPGGTTLASGSKPVQYTNNNYYGYLLSAAYTLAKATAYRLVYTLSGATTVPRALKNYVTNATNEANGYSTVLRAARVGGSGWYYACANGTTDWAGGTPLTDQDDQDAQPDMYLLFEDQVAVTATGGGGGGPIILGGGVGA